MKTSAKLLITIFFTTFILHGCGYKNPYIKNIDLNERAATIYMTIWANQTNELGLENLIFQSTADWLQQSRHLQITRNNDRADYILTGKITSVDYPATAFSTDDKASTLQATVTTTYKLTDQASGKTIWKYDSTLESSYTAGSDAVNSQSSKKIALMSIADDLGEQIYLSVTNTLTSE